MKSPEVEKFTIEETNSIGEKRRKLVKEQSDYNEAKQAIRLEKGISGMQQQKKKQRRQNSQKINNLRRIVEE